MNPEEMQKFLAMDPKKMTDLELLGALTSLLGTRSRIEQTRQTHPDLYSECSRYATSNMPIETIKQMPPDCIVLMNANMLEDLTKMRLPNGPIAKLVVLAEWLNEHPTVMMDIVNDPRWSEV